MRDSKFGRAQVLETFANRYILGFRVDPQDKINQVFQGLQSFFQVYSAGPLFGVDFAVEAETPGRTSPYYFNTNLCMYVCMYDNHNRSCTLEVEVVLHTIHHYHHHHHHHLTSSLSGIDQLLQRAEDVEIVEDQEDTYAIAAYYAADSNLVDDELRFERIFYEPRLGLAVETMADGISIEQLWLASRVDLIQSYPINNCLFVFICLNYLFRNVIKSPGTTHHIIRLPNICTLFKFRQM
jgi:Bardet-Biedl syndrome 5 protein